MIKRVFEFDEFQLQRLRESVESHYRGREEILTSQEERYTAIMASGEELPYFDPTMMVQVRAALDEQVVGVGQLAGLYALLGGDLSDLYDH